MAIPHIIHFVWVGGNKFNELAERCIQSWKLMCPDYQIICWNENNFDVNSNIFVKEAYDAKKWAFVSDYIRLYVLYNYGGIYMDADMELLRNIDSIVDENDAFTGYQGNTIPSGIMASNKNNVWIEELLKYYNNKHFIKKDGTYDLETNSEIITKISRDIFGFKFGDDIIEKGNVKLYPEVYFSPYKKNVFIKDNKKFRLQYKIDKKHTHGIHHYAGSWEPQNTSNNFLMFIKAVLRLIMPQKLYQYLQDTWVERRMNKFISK